MSTIPQTYQEHIKFDIPKTYQSHTKNIHTALQAATVLVAMASRKKDWRPKLSGRSPVWRPVSWLFDFFNLHPDVLRSVATTKLLSVFFFHNFRLFKDLKNMSFLDYSPGIVKSSSGHFDAKEEGKLGLADYKHYSPPVEWA